MMLSLALVVMVEMGCTLPATDRGSCIPENAERSYADLDGARTPISLFVSPGQMQPGWTWWYDGATYSLGVDAFGVVQYIETSSPCVETPTGVRVGLTLQEVETMIEVSMIEWPGWGYVAELPNGWNAAFFPKEWKEPGPSDVVQRIFKGNLAGYGAKASRPCIVPPEKP